MVSKDTIVEAFHRETDGIVAVDSVTHTGEDEHGDYFVIGYRTHNEQGDTLVCFRYFLYAKEDSYKDDTLLKNGIQMRASGDGRKLYDALGRGAKHAVDQLKDGNDEWEPWGAKV